MTFWADTTGTVEMDGRTIEWKVRWYKDKKTDTTDIDEIMEVTVWKDYTEEQDLEFYGDHQNVVDDLIIEAAYKKGEPEFDETVSWQQLKECAAEMEE